MLWGDGFQTCILNCKTEGREAQDRPVRDKEATRGAVHLAIGDSERSTWRVTDEVVVLQYRPVLVFEEECITKRREAGPN